MSKKTPTMPWIADAAKKGGNARANVLTPQERKEIAQTAARKRWGKTADSVEDPVLRPIERSDEGDSGIPYSMFRGTLAFGGLEMECHVLNDGRRVFTQREIVKVLSGGREGGELGRYLERIPNASNELVAGPIIRFRIPGNPTDAVGREATTLVEICDAYLSASDLGLLRPNQRKLAVQAGIIIRASAKVGIVALVDEATGYQQVRAKNALQLKLQAFIADEMQEWARQFPTEFWMELARLEGVHYSPRSRPIRWGKYIMMFVYDAIDGDVGKELRKRNPNPQHRRNHHQWLQQFGKDKLKDQITRVVTIMRLCDDMDDFRKKFAHVFKKSPLQLEFGDLVP